MASASGRRRASPAVLLLTIASLLACLSYVLVRESSLLRPSLGSNGTGTGALLLPSLLAPDAAALIGVDPDDADAVPNVREDSLPPEPTPSSLASITTTKELLPARSPPPRKPHAAVPVAPPAPPGEIPLEISLMPHGWLGDEFDDNAAIVELLESTTALRTKDGMGPACPRRAGRGATDAEGFELTVAGGNGAAAGAAAPCHRLGVPLDVTIHTMGRGGHRHCLGGDFFETELSNGMFKSRPKTVDNGDGTYTVRLLVPADAGGLLAGRYRLRVTLLFTRYSGVTMWQGWKRDYFFKKPKELAVVFGATCGDPPTSSAPTLAGAGGAPAVTPLGDAECGASFDFRAPEWAGFWLRAAPDSPLPACRRPYCVGDVRRALGAEADGWVYRLPSCYFRLYTPAEARGCLGGGWVHMVGDSNHQDTGRNLAHDLLGAPGLVKKGGALPRTFDVRARWEGRRGSFRVSNLFNGAPATMGNNVGMRGYDDAGLRAKHWSPFREVPPPTAFVFNSGLHDALYMPGRVWSPRRFARILDGALAFFGELLDAAAKGGGSSGGSGDSSGPSSRGGAWRGGGGNSSTTSPPRGPLAIWHTTVAPAGVKNRRMPLNPQKIEIQNRMTTNALGGRFLVVDVFDMTFPWHWNNQFSDGGHYGRPAWHRNKGGKLVGSTTFVDVMYCHVLAAAICGVPRAET